MAEMASFNGFDGEHVTQVLRDNPDLWEGMVFGRFQYSPLITLRDISDGHINADTMYIIAKEGKEKELEILALKQFGADEVDYDDWASKQLGQFLVRKKVLRAWWD